MADSRGACAAVLSPATVCIGWAASNGTAFLFNGMLDTYGLPMMIRRLGRWAALLIPMRCVQPIRSPSRSDARTSRSGGMRRLWPYKDVSMASA